MLIQNRLPIKILVFLNREKRIKSEDKLPQKMHQCIMNMKYKNQITKKMEKKWKNNNKKMKISS